ncbi:MAG TPA: glycosyltransferase family 39 protein [Solirubrobacteraceae bacterium]|nr:glycosyltransferase family 39 protein [Solirubrobacteraceae bacterium]
MQAGHIAGAGPAGGEDPQAYAEQLPGLARRPVFAVAALLGVVLMATSGSYGYHRDELYFLACGQHLAWGYPDQPVFVPLLARLMSDLAPTSLVLLRLPSTLAAVALVALTGMLTRELGGNRAMQMLAATSIALAAVVDASAHTLNTTVFDLVAWALLCWLIVRILRTGSERLWLAVGVVVGLGLLDSDLVAFLMFAVVVGLAVAGPRRALASPWLYAGGSIAVLMWTPYLAWQASHGWPELTVARSIANGGSGTSAPRWLILPEQLELVSLFLSPVWIAGLARLLRDPALRWCRALGVAYIVLAIAVIVTGGKPYYLGGMFPLLLAAGAQPVLQWMRRGRPRVRRALLVAAVMLSLTAIPVTLPIVPVGDLHDTAIVKLNYDAGETVGWPAYVHEIANVYASLPAAQRRTTVVLASNYGEAGAVDHYGPADGLPAVYSGHMAYWYWGPPPASTNTAVAVGLERNTLAAFCGALHLAVHLDNHLDVNDDEQGEPVWVCSDLRAPWTAIWPTLRDFG